MRKESKLVNTRFLLLILMAVFSLSISAQKITLKGHVEDGSGESIVGATVQEKGVNNGTITDLNGNFTLKISGQKAVVVSFVGMQTKEIKPKDKTFLKIVLQEDAKTLDEVVVIGYGSTKKKDLTGSVSSVQGSTLTKVPVSSTIEALTGRLAGVQITTTDGSPDAEMIIRVRGGGSVTGDNTPLYIVDGFPVSSINDISSNDIQSIDVLKDASSTAIYGSQGANGVVIITTTSATGGKTKISYNGFVKSKKISKKLDVLDTYQYVMANYELAALSSTEKSFENTFGVYDDLDLYKYVKNHDWQKDMFGSDVASYSQNLSIQGGSEKTKFSLSGTYTKDGGLMKSNNYSRFTGNFKLSHEISKKLLFKMNIRMSDAITNGSGTSGGNYKIRTSQAITSMATKGLSEFTDIDTSTMDDDEYQEYLRNKMSLSEQAAQYWKKKNQRAFNYTGSLDWMIMKNLTFRLEGGYAYGFNETKDWWGATTNNASYVGGLPLADWTKQNTSKIREAMTLTYKLKLNKGHQINLMVGQETNSTRGDKNYMYATEFSKDLTAEQVFANFGLADGESYQTTSYKNADENLASYFGRFGYNYKDRYLATLTFRSDGSSKFAKGNQWGFFPAGAVAWRINQESFMKNTKEWLSNLKLRLSYGEAGNNRIASTLYQMTYSINTAKAYGIGDVANNYYAPSNSTLANPKLKWESTITRNAGLDFGFFNERLTGTVEYYWNTAKDLLIKRTIVAPGYDSTIENTAQTSNKGFEVSLNAYILQKKDAYLSANFNISVNRSKVDKLANGLSQMEFASGWAGTDNKGYYDYLVKVGQPVGLIRGWVTDGYYTTDDFSSYDGSNYILKDGVPTNGMLGGRIGVRPGTIKFKDLDGDGAITDADRTVIGKTNPKFTGGFGLNGGYKGFDISILFNFVYGNKIYNANKIASSQSYRTSYPNMLGFMNSNNRYTYLDQATGTIVTDLATLKAMNEGKNAKKYWSPWSFGNAVVMPHSWAIEDGSFLRLQNVTLGYTLPAKFTKKFMCSRFRVYCTLNDVFCLTGYSGYDPEVSSSIRSSSASGLTPGVDYSCYPKSFSWTAGVNITF